jgi:hypothetical protein
MGRYIILTGSTGLGSILLTSPRITGHRQRRVRSPSPAADEVFKKAPSPLQHSLCGVGVSDSLPVRNVPQVISPASGVTQSVGDDDGVEPPTLPGSPGKPATSGVSGTTGLGQGGGDTGADGVGGAGEPDVRGDGLALG